MTLAALLRKKLNIMFTPAMPTSQLLWAPVEAPRAPETIFLFLVNPNKQTSALHQETHFAQGYPLPYSYIKEENTSG